MIYIKYCKKCRKAFDIAINYEICPECRMKKEEKNENKRFKTTSIE